MILSVPLRTARVQNNFLTNFRDENLSKMSNPNDRGRTAQIQTKPEKMKVIFLDMDGVLAKFGATYQSPYRLERGLYTCLEPELVFILNKLVDETEAELVLSSSWRHDPQWREIMKVSGIIKPFYDCTSLVGGHNRGNFITAWLKKHPEVTQYAILDDNEDAGIGHAKNFFKTKTEEGLTETHAQAIKQLFI